MVRQGGRGGWERVSERERGLVTHNKTSGGAVPQDIAI